MKIDKKRKNNVKDRALQLEKKEIEDIRNKYDGIDSKNIAAFQDFPISAKTLKGLKEAGYKIPTDIQRESIGPALQGKDILAAAQTGSGKTLAFLIPILERLYIKQWTKLDGLGAVIISPTRELALQIHETIRKVGKYHELTYGLVIGGQNLKFEKHGLNQLNVMICTPGRLLQHMDENPLFECINMHILVLDEADRCLDLGFEQSMNAIIENFPQTKQILLYSATQTKSVKDLARLNLTEPLYIEPHLNSKHSTPESMQQSYVVVELENKFSMLWSFLKAHIKQKIIVFFATCKQVKYFHEIFLKLRPGIKILALHGGMNQERRNKIYNEFKVLSNVCLLTTDVASRGVDFPKINWVVQIDCPEDVAQYIHRAGRTARHKASGENLLVLLPSELNGMVEELTKTNVPINEIQIDEKQIFTPKAKVEGFLAQSSELKESAKRAFIAYIKSVAFMKNKNIFNVDSLNLDAFSKSLGLVATPRVRFLQKLQRIKLPQSTATNKQETKTSLFTNDDSDDDNDDEFLTVKRDNHTIEEYDDAPEEIPIEKIAKINEAKKKPLTKAKLAKRSLILNKKVMFDEDGNEDGQNDKESYDIEEARKIMEIEDERDKHRYKEFLKEKRKIKKENKKNKQKDTDADVEFQAEDNLSRKSQAIVHLGQTDSSNRKRANRLSTEDDDDSVDLSWLPDPDNVYKSNKSSEKLKTKMKQVLADLPKKKRKKMDKITDMSLNDTETFVMNLLKS